MRMDVNGVDQPFQSHLSAEQLAHAQSAMARVAVQARGLGEALASLGPALSQLNVALGALSRSRFSSSALTRDGMEGGAVDDAVVFDDECTTCGHAASWHRLDSSLNVSPCDPAAQFRCCGPSFGSCDVRCNDFMGLVCG